MSLIVFVFISVDSVLTHLLLLQIDTNTNTVSRMDEVTRSVVDVIKDTLVLLLESCADVPDSQETSNLGAALLDRLEGAVRFIGVNDIRYDSSGDMTLIDELENFHRSKKNGESVSVHAQKNSGFESSGGGGCRKIQCSSPEKI